ncbi:MAG: hypothetical protein WAO58_05580 [Fimbriimonadaceae bacterium]
MRAIALLLAVAMAGSAAPRWEQAPSPRMRVIWEAFNERLVMQNDIWFEDGEFPRVVQLLRVLYAMTPNSYEQATNLGWMLENIERWNEALAVYVGFRKQNAFHPEAYFPEADFYFKRKMYTRVPPLLEPTLKMPIKPHANSYRLLALSYERTGLLGDAQRVWNLLIKRDPADGAAKMNLSRVEKKLRGEQAGK